MEKFKIDIISLKVCHEKRIEFLDHQLSSPNKVYNVVKQFLGVTDREYFGVLMMSSANTIYSLQICSIGTVDTTIVHPREVFKSAIKTNASKIILFHSHPSNNLNPSQYDIDVTKSLIDVSKIIQIPILDHIIICENDYYSLLAHGILSKEED